MKLSETKDLRYAIDMARSLKELDEIAKSLPAESYLHGRIRNARRIVRHFEFMKSICQIHLKN